jgi:hypothetical protein
MNHDRLSAAAPWIAVALALAAPGRSSMAAAPEPPKGLVLHFSFDQSESDGKVTDRSPEHNNGQATGARWTSAGKQGGGVELAPAENFIRVANSPSLSPKQATFALWFKTSTTDATWRRLLDKREDSGFGLGIGGDAKPAQTRGKLAFSIGGDKVCLSDTVVADGAWHHAAATFDGDNLKLYVDGLPQKQVVAFHGEIPANDDDLTIGMNRSNPAPEEKGKSLGGMIDDVMIFNRALSAEEIKAMVAAVDPSAGKPKFTKQQVAGRLRQLRLLYEEGLLTDDYYERKVEECKAAAQ